MIVRPSFNIRPVLAGVAALLAAVLSSAPAFADDSSVQGNLVANGEPVELPYVYVWAEEKGFYKDDDPTWTLFFVGRPLSAREIGETVWDAPWIEIGITQTRGQEDDAELQVYTQSIRMSADSGGNLSGGTYPEFEIQGLGEDVVSGRVWLPETQEFFDDTYVYDLTFTAPMSDPNAMIGEPLPEGGGEPGQAYLVWVKTLHSGDVDALKKIVPPELAEQLDSVSEEEAADELDFMRSMTPKDVTILGGSIDGDEAYLQIQGSMDGESLEAEVTMSRMGDFWIPTATSM